jgi:outer membrane protein assembly factor BamB
VPARMFRALVLILVTGVLFAPSDRAASSGADSAGMRFSNVEFSHDDELTAGSVATIQFTIEDGDGSPVTGLRASGLLRAPSTAQDDSPPSPTLTTIGRELGDPGRYEVAVALNQPGRWWIEVRVDNGSGQIARYDHFAIVDAVDQLQPATTSDPVFLRGDDWDAFYRVDPNTGSVATLEGADIFQVGDRWWIADIDLQQRGSISSEYGGSWRLTVELRDAINGSELTSINLGDVRANVYSGSQNDPAIATALSVAPDGSAMYIYWARQLGEGWIGHLAEVDPLTGEVRNERVINGAISSNGFWAEIYLRDDGRVVVAEQVVEMAAVSGYRLSIIERGTLETIAQYRRTDAREDPLTHCILAYPGPIGSVSGDDGNRYSLCSPPEIESDRALLIWDPLNAQAEHVVRLDELIREESEFTDGIASPDGTTFYAVNTRTMRIAEIDLATGEVLRERNLLPDDEEDPSTLDRFFDWVFGSTGQTATASPAVESGVTISPDGETLFVAANPEDREPGIMVVDISDLEIINSLKTGEVVDGLLSTPDGRVVVIQRDNGENGDSLTVLDKDGSTFVSFTLPGYTDIVGARQ